MQHPSLPLLTDRVLLVPWPDAAVERVGHDPRAPYVERFWLPILGPTTTLLTRRLAAELERSPDGCELNLLELADALGLQDRTGRDGPFMRSFRRLVQFAIARPEGECLAIRRRLPSLTARQLSRLPAALQLEHEQLALIAGLSERLAAERAVALGRTLLELGEPAGDVWQQLLDWRFEPALALAAVHEAADQLGFDLSTAA